MRRNMRCSAALRGLEDGPAALRIGGESNANFLVGWFIARPGCLDEFETLTGEMVASTRAESGVLAYQRFISEDRQTVYVH